MAGQCKAYSVCRVQVKQSFTDGDHYVIKFSNQAVALVGNEAGSRRGSAYAVYDLLERFGCGWYGPDSIWQVMPKTNNMNLREFSVNERSDFLLMRRIWKMSEFASQGRACQQE